MSTCRVSLFIIIVAFFFFVGCTTTVQQVQVAPKAAREQDNKNFVFNVANIEIINNDIGRENTTNIANVLPRQSLIDWLSYRMRAHGAQGKLTITIDKAKIEEVENITQIKNSTAKKAFLCSYRVSLLLEDGITHNNINIAIDVHNKRDIVSISTGQQKISLAEQRNVLVEQVQDLLSILATEMQQKIDFVLSPYVIEG
ncbi:hypothetical protein MIDIC_20064 [Alphaproteobacteria bacterium]